MEIRELRYFVAVAEELHFGRAAQRLTMTQPPLSRAIQQLEGRLGVGLLHRTSRAIALTSAGSVLLREARHTLEAVEAAERRTLRAAAEEPTLVLAAKAGASRALVSRLLEAYAAEPGAVAVEMMLCGPGEAEGLLRDGTADAAILQQPYDTTAGFDTEDLHTEPQVVVLPAGHPLGELPSASMDDITSLTELPLPRWPRPDGSYPHGPGPKVRDLTQLTQLITLGRACALMPESLGTSLRDEHVVVPVPDAPLVATVIAWPPHSRSRSVAALLRTAMNL